MIVSTVLPKGVEGFDLLENVWVAEPRFAIPLAVALRQSLIDVATSRQAQEGRQTKTKIVYSYLTGPRFRHRIEAIVEKFTDMQKDLDREGASMSRLWAKREEQLRGVLESTAGLYGDIQGIAGRAMQEIESLDVLMIEAKGEAAEQLSGRIRRADYYGRWIAQGVFWCPGKDCRPAPTNNAKSIT